MLFHLYRSRLRSQLAHELRAGSGIAVGVALVFAVLVASASLTGSASEVVHRVVGSARLQLAARSPTGFDERLATAVKQLPGVHVSAPVLRENVAVVGRHGRRSAQLLGVTNGVAAFGGLGTRAFGQGGFRLSGGLVLPANIATAIGVEVGDTVTVLAYGSAHAIKVGAVLDSALFGGLAASPVAIALLPVAQRLAESPGRVTEILVQPIAGADRLVRSELQHLAAGRLDVVSADNELRLLNQAAEPTNRSTTLFAVISAMVGFLLALSAILLTVPERRRYIADLRMDGYDARQAVIILGFQALILGTAASLVGIGLGDIFSRVFFNVVPAYLASAFPVDARQVLHAQTILLALVCGVLATMLASLLPVFDLRASRSINAVLRDPTSGGEAIAPQTALRLGVATAFVIAFVAALVVIAPGLTILGGVALAASTLGLVPAMFVGVARGLSRASEHVRGAALNVALSELRVTTTRSVALAGIAGLAVYGSIAIGGSRDDLLRGLDTNFAQYLHTADIWVTTGGNDLATNGFHVDGAVAGIAHVPGISSVRAYQGGLLDVGPRRLWIIARPGGDPGLIQASQLLHGDLRRATQLLRQGNWATISNGFAAEHHLRVGSSFSLPTPSGSARLGVAAITTNLGWSPGALILTTRDFLRYWGTADPSALEISVKPGVAPATAKRSVEQALGPRPGLGIQTLKERQTQYAADSRQGLQALSEISTLLQIAAAMAVAFGLIAAIRRRLARFASLKIQGYTVDQLWAALLLESTVVLGVGCAVGAVLGVYGHALASRWLRLTTGFPAPFSFGLGHIFLTLGLVAGIALLVIAWRGLAVARVPTHTSLRE